MDSTVESLLAYNLTDGTVSVLFVIQEHSVKQGQLFVSVPFVVW